MPCTRCQGRERAGTELAVSCLALTHVLKLYCSVVCLLTA